jgi:hypothetical protein
MRASWLGPSCIVAALCASLLGACAAGSNSNGLAGGGNGGAGTGGATSTSSSGLGGGLGVGTGGSTGPGDAGTLHAYAHTNTVLFQLDPTQANLGLTQIGTFDCIGGGGQDSSMTDIAVNEAGDLWGVSEHNVYQLQIQGSTVACLKTIPVNSPATFYGLTFAPVGVIGTTEALVAADTAGDLWVVDTTSGTLTQHGNFGTVPASDGQGHTYKYAGQPWELSGDIVFLANNGSPLGFATVRDCPSPPSSSDCDDTDTLIQIDTTLLAAAGAQVVTKSVRGEVVKAAGCTDTANSHYGSMYGIAAYQDKVYGFSHEGFIVSIDNNDGTACLVLSTPNDEWAGAAITTLAPVQPPTTE